MALSRLGRCCRLLLCESTKGVTAGVSRTRRTQGCTGAKRHLLTDNIIRLQEFQQQKLASALRVAGPQENFVELLSQKIQKKDLLLKDDLKLLLHLCQSVDDVLVARDAIIQYHSENRNLAYGEFKFGPLFMRQCYELGLDDLATTTITDERMKGFFDATSFNIAMDIAFINGSYENVLKILRTMSNQGMPLNQDSLKLASGTYYKLNTEESFKVCLTMIEKEQAGRRPVPRLAFCFATSLAIRQNNVEKAQTMFENIERGNTRLCQNLMVLIKAMSGDMPGAISILSRALVPSLPFVRKPEFSQEMLHALCLLSEGGPHKPRLLEAISKLEKANQVIQLTIDDMLCRTHTFKKKHPFLGEAKRRTSRRTLRELPSNLFSE